MQNKEASILLEVIFSVVITSIVVINAMLIYKEFFEINSKNFKTEVSKIELLNTKFFLQKNLIVNLDSNHLQYKNENLYFKDALLLKNVSSYSLQKFNSSININLCLNDTICKKFVIVL